MEEIGKRWEELRKNDRVAAWQFLQRALMENMSILVPQTVSLKDLLASCTSIEEMLKGQQVEKGKSPAEIIGEWLNDEETAAEKLSVLGSEEGPLQ